MGSVHGKATVKEDRLDTRYTRLCHMVLLLQDVFFLKMGSLLLFKFQF